MSVYVIATIDIHDRQTYGRYEAGFVEIFARYDGEVLSVDESPEVLEGSWPATRTVLLRFPDRGALRAWYDSDDYQTLMQHRLSASIGNIAMLNGIS